MMKLIVQVMLLVLPILGFAHKNDETENDYGSIKGHVTTNDNKPAADVTVHLKGINKQTITKEDGSFSINKLSSGVYEIEISLVGYETLTQNITIEKNKVAEISLQLKLSQSQLDEVVVTSAKNKFATKKSESVARMPLKNLENPQAYTVIPKELLTEQVVTNFSDALKNSSGLDKLWTSTGRSSDGAGYYSLRGFSTQASLVDGIAGQTNGDLDPANMEKIEVIKGPSGTLFGGALTNFGGLINIATKKPIDTLGGEIAYTTGSYNMNRITADVYGPVNKSKNLFFRLNAAYTNQSSFQDAGFSKSTFIAPVVEYRVNDKLKFNIGVEFYNAEGTNTLMVFLNRSRQLIARTPSELNFDWKRSYTSNDITIKTPTTNIHGQATYKLSNNWTSQTSFSRSTRKSDGLYQYVMYVGATDTMLTRYLTLQNSISNSADIQQNFIGDFKVGTLRNRIVAGLDFLNQISNNSNSPYILFDSLSSNKNSSKYVGLSRTAVDAKIAASTSAPTKTSSLSNVYSAYVSDVLNLTDKLLVMASVRVDRFDNKGSYNQATNATVANSAYAQTAVSPKFGVVYNIIKDQVAIFGNYMNGFKNVAPVTQPLADISGTFKPQHANQIEGGVKLDILKNRLSLTASYYDIKVDNTTRTETLIRDNISYNITVQNGTQTSKGYELDMIATPITGLNIIAGYSHNNSVQTKTSAALDGRRPTSAGPADLINAWFSYTLVKGKAKGWGLGFGGNYGSENMITNSSTTGAFTLPTYTVLNTSVFYNAKTFRLGFKLNNIANKQYFKGWSTVEVQMPRQFLANIAFRF